MAGALAQFVGSAVSGNTSPYDDDDTVAERRHFLHDVAGKHDAAAFVTERADHVAYGAGRHDVQTVGGLVQDYVLGAMHERAGDGDFGALAVRRWMIPSMPSAPVQY